MAESFGFATHVASLVKSALTPYKLDLFGNYSVKTEPRKYAQYDELTAGIVNGARLEYTYRPGTITVKNMPMQTPNPDMTGITVGCKFTAIGSHTNPDGKVVDSPFGCSIQFYGVSNALDEISEAQMQDFLLTAISGLYDESNNFLGKKLFAGQLQQTGANV